MKPAPGQTASGKGGSYKFERLRERLRRAIESGELSGKLPGERELARRFQVNAKTMSKALTDLTSEGLLVRQVGRGTFVADQLDERYPIGRPRRYRWLVGSGDPNRRQEAMYELAASRLAGQGHELQRQHAEVDEEGRLKAGWLSPGRLREVDGVIIFWAGPSDELVCELHRRHIPLVLAACAMDFVKSNAVHPDWARGAYELSEQLIWLGHRRITLSLPASCPLVRREAERGYRAALTRYGLGTGRTVPCTSEHLELEADGANRPSAVVSLGSEARGRIEQAFRRSGGGPGAAMAVILPPGEGYPSSGWGLSYGFDREAFVDWTIRLLLEATPGHQPREVIMPGWVAGQAGAAAEGGQIEERYSPGWVSL